MGKEGFQEGSWREHSREEGGELEGAQQGGRLGISISIGREAEPI